MCVCVFFFNQITTLGIILSFRIKNIKRRDISAAAVVKHCCYLEVMAAVNYRRTRFAAVNPSLGGHLFALLKIKPICRMIKDFFFFLLRSIIQIIIIIIIQSEITSQRSLIEISLRT